MINGFLKVENFYLKIHLLLAVIQLSRFIPGKTCLKYYADAFFNQSERDPHLIN